MQAAKLVTGSQEPLPGGYPPPDGLRPGAPQGTSASSLPSAGRNECATKRGSGHRRGTGDRARPPLPWPAGFGQNLR